MAQPALADLAAAHGELAAFVRGLPDEALDWRADDESWSLKQTIAHVTHAYDFYLMIVEETLGAGFGTVQLHPELAGWQRLLATDAAVNACTTVSAALDLFNQAYERLNSVLEHLTLEELDHEFVLLPLRPDAEAVTRTLRRRVLETAADHLREHQAQMSDTLAGWRSSK
jgi:uncharacterized damage-inducible protein DinB